MRASSRARPVLPVIYNFAVLVLVQHFLVMLIGLHRVLLEQLEHALRPPRLPPARRGPGGCFAIARPAVRAPEYKIPGP